MKSDTGIQSEPSIQEKRAALDFALTSESLGRSDRLKSLLRFVCEAELSGEENRFSEYEIAVSALGRREDFSPNEDSTVRSRAHELRRKLERLYATEAPDYPIRIDLPKGSYRPKFARIETLSEKSLRLSAVDGVAPEPLARSRRQWSMWLTASLSFVLGLLVSALMISIVGRHRPTKMSASQRLTDPRWTPELRELWIPLLTGSRPVVVVFETRLFVDVGPLVVRDRMAETMHDVESSASITQVKRLFNTPEIFEARRYTDFSVANALFSIAELASTSGLPLKAERALDLTEDDVRSSNLILLGKPGRFDPVRGIPPEGSNFVFQEGGSAIQNLHPRPGEQAIYQKSGIAESAGATEEYGIIRLSPERGANQHVLSLVSAESEMYGPLASYITDPIYAKDLVRHLRLPSGKLPDAFEVLIKADLRARRPIRIEYVTHRVITHS